MRKYLKAGLAVSLALVMTISQATTIGFAANGNNGNGKGNTKQNEIKIQTQVTEEAKAELRERLRVMITIGGGTWDGIPEGMAKKGYLPYGLAKRYMNGNFPYGLLKRMPNFQFGNQTENKNLINLKNLISSAEYRLSDYNKKTYENQEATKATLQIAINAAKAIAQISSPTEIEVKDAYDALKAAVELFDGKELVGIQKLNELKKIEKELLLYKSMLVIDNTKPDEVAHLAKLNALIEKVQKYIGVDNAKLTLSIFNEIVKEAELFKNYLQPLKDLVKEVEAFVLANVKVGTAPGEYQLVDVTKINDEVAIAKAVIAANPPKSILEVEAAFKRLEAAFEAFKLKKIVSVEDINTFKLLYAELEFALTELDDATKEAVLTAFLLDMKPYKDGVKPLTQDLMYDFLDEANKYLPDLYKPIVDEIKALIVTANTIVETFEETYTEAQQVILTGLLDDIKEEIINAEFEIDDDPLSFVELNDVHGILKAAIDDFNFEVAKMKLNETLNFAEDKVVNMDLEKYEDIVSLEEKLEAVVDAIDELSEKIALIKADLADLDADTTSELEDYKTELLNLIKEVDDTFKVLDDAFEALE